MHLKATINRARTEITLETLVANQMVGGSMYIYELIVDVNLYVGRESLRAYFGVDKQTIADKELIYVETLNDGYTRYKCKIPNELYKKVQTMKLVELSLLLLDVGEDGEGLDTILVAPPHFFTVQPNSLNYEETMTPEEAEQFNSSLAVVVAKLNELAQQLPAKWHFGELVKEQGTVVNSELAAVVKIFDLYYNTKTCDLFLCTGKNPTDTAWQFLGNNKGETGDIMYTVKDEEATDVEIDLLSNHDYSYKQDLTSLSVTISEEFVHGCMAAIHFGSGITATQTSVTNNTGLEMIIINAGLEVDDCTVNADRSVTFYFENTGRELRLYIEEV